VSVEILLENKWCMTVMDTGHGISKEDKERIFDPFYTTKIKGSGLGLAFVKQAVTAHGGSVTAENRPDGGSVFSIVIPGME
ncbi:MAG: HAMP domain-containing histidine kinase, partial [Desulfobacula sp.]|uniref:ATP-binding protein n=1 Tax=Desulfobacula sp. TaxID=2593537 RepID=UPI0025C22D76